MSVINKNHWKLYLYHEEWQLDGGHDALATNNAVELYNLNDDIGERKNIANIDINRRDELLNELLNWFQKTGAKLPSEINPAYDPDKPLSKNKPKRNQKKKANRKQPSSSKEKP